MEKSSKRGKIPQQDWPSIIKRYEAGETLASIARTYDCSPPAISYILSRNRARDATVDGTEQSGSESPEPQPVKGQPNDTRVSEFLNGTPKMGEAVAVKMGEAVAVPPTAAASDPTHASGPEPVPAGPGSASNRTAGMSEIGAEIAVTETPDRSANRDIEVPAPHAALSGTGNTPGALGIAGPQPQPGEPRPTLHLSLSHNNAQPMEAARHEGHVASITDASAVRPAGDQQQRFAQNHPAPNPVTNNGGAARPTAEPDKRIGATFIDRALRERVDGDISAFLAAFDAALAQDTMESRAGLREATDRLLRAGARTRIELERLEARVPLSARDTSGYSPASWRPR